MSVTIFSLFWKLRYVKYVYPDFWAGSTLEKQELLLACSVNYTQEDSPLSFLFLSRVLKTPQFISKKQTTPHEMMNTRIRKKTISELCFFSFCHQESFRNHNHTYSSIFLYPLFFTLHLYCYTSLNAQGSAICSYFTFKRYLVKQ